MGRYVVPYNVFLVIVDEVRITHVCQFDGTLLSALTCCEAE